MIRHLVIVGPTASGKTTLSLDIANQFNGEIICADSRTVYKGMDIGTAKPTVKERGKIKHHCLDLVYPNEQFTVAGFKHNANEALGEIIDNNKLAITVGGSGLYVNSFIYDYSFVQHNTEAYILYKNESIENLQKIIIDKGLVLPENYKNKRYLLNTLARDGNQGTNNSKLPQDTLIIGINPPDEDLRNKIIIRSDQMFRGGVVEEVKALTAKYGKICKALQGGIYSALQDYIEDKEDLEIAKIKSVTADWQLAKRQRTWFKRNKDIVWFCNVQEANKWLIDKI